MTTWNIFFGLLASFMCCLLLSLRNPTVSLGLPLLAGIPERAGRTGEGRIVGDVDSRPDGPVGHDDLLREALEVSLRPLDVVPLDPGFLCLEEQVIAEERRLRGDHAPPA